MHTFAALIKVGAVCMYVLALLYVNKKERQKKEEAVEGEEAHEDVKENGITNAEDKQKEGEEEETMA